MQFAGTRTAPPMSGTVILLRKSHQFQFITTHVCGGNKSKRKPFFALLLHIHLFLSAVNSSLLHTIIGRETQDLSYVFYSNTFRGQ
jgi:hypothetical protein